ncbi:phage antirepressor N-terminal domain-containing protein [Pectobacterium sp. CHL-2024]|uniref:phage antirepressor N-terminal domain-containing protein n=1 Tax=Pectobacterium sp. CHL-2024 TaxID=3377079 RepID=UPI0037F8B593
MNSIATAPCAINVPFYGTDLYVINHCGEPYTPMKPIIEGMGMDWASQFTKLKHRFKACVVKITMQIPGDDQRRDVICLALRKLAAWLNTISPNKVKAEIRDRVIRYQNECDDVLYEYWTKGKVTNPRKARQSTAKQLTPLRQTVERLIATGMGNIYGDIWKLVHKRYEIDTINQLQPDQIGEAVAYLDGLEGEYIQRGQQATKTTVAPVGSRRVLLYLDANGSVTGSLPIAPDELVASWDTFAQLARREGWIVMHKNEVFEKMTGAIENLQ